MSTQEQGSLRQAQGANGASSRSSSQRADSPERRTPRFTESVALIAGREITTRLRSKAFLISTAILMLAVLASIVIGGLIGNNADPAKVAVVPGALGTVAASEALDPVEVADEAEGEALLRDGEVEAIIVPSSSGPLDVTVIALDETPNSVVQALSVSPSVELLEAAGPNPLFAYFVALGFGLVFFMSAITFGSTISQSVVEEKQTRIVEILLSTVSARALLTGKVLGNSIMAFGQIVAIAILAILGLVITDQPVAIGGLGSSIVWFIVFFAVGFVMLAALFAGTSAMVSRAEDVGSVTTPVTMLVMIPYFLVIFFNDNSTVLTIMSYVPFSAPVGMPMRIFLEEAAWWEPLVSLVILLATAALAVLIGERIYRNSLLKMGGRVKLTEALKG